MTLVNLFNAIAGFVIGTALVAAVIEMVWENGLGSYGWTVAWLAAVALLSASRKRKDEHGDADR